MLAIQAIKSVYTRVNEYMTKKSEYYRLSKLDPYLLEDMGIMLKDGEVISTRKNERQASPQTQKANVVDIESAAIKRAAFESPPQASRN